MSGLTRIRSATRRKVNHVAGAGGAYPLSLKTHLSTLSILRTVAGGWLRVFILRCCLERLVRSHGDNLTDVIRNARPKLARRQRGITVKSFRCSSLRIFLFQRVCDSSTALRGTFFIDHNIIHVTGPDQAWSPKICGRQQRRQVFLVPVVKLPAKELENAGAGVGPVGVDD
jgi:hypothetical protein